MKVLVTIIDVRGRTSFTDWFVLCNGTNPQQLGIAEHVVRTCKAEDGLQPGGSRSRNGQVGTGGPR